MGSHWLSGAESQPTSLLGVRPKCLHFLFGSLCLGFKVREGQGGMWGVEGRVDGVEPPALWLPLYA